MYNDESSFILTNKTHPAPPTIAPPIPLFSFFGVMYGGIE